MKSAKLTLDHLISGLTSLYRQTQVDHFQQFRAALEACDLANNNGGSRYYLLNASGQDFCNVFVSCRHGGLLLSGIGNLVIDWNLDRPLRARTALY
jgi:hypothetical protein